MGLIKDALDEFLKDDCPRMAAALSYYTIFSLPGVLMVVMLVAGVFVETERIQGRLLAQIQQLVGSGGAEQVQAILRNLKEPGTGNPVVVVLTVVVILFAATGAFAQLQNTLNRTWEVAPDPDAGGMIRTFLTKRVLSFLLILGVAFLLLVSVVAQTVLTAFGSFVAGVLPEALSGPALRTISLGLSFVVAVLLFGAMFQFLPDARVHWRDAWRGAAATAVLFLLGNLLFGLYLSRGSPGSAYGAAGSLAVLLVWIYYSSMIFFFGAEVTQVLAERRGAEIRPAPGAVRVVVERRQVEDDGTAPASSDGESASDEESAAGTARPDH